MASGARLPGKCRRPCRKASRNAGDELAPKDLPQHGNREEEARPRVDPLGAIRRQAASRHDAVDVGMVLQPLAPRVEDHQPANVGHPGASDSLATWSKVSAAA